MPMRRRFKGWNERSVSQKKNRERKQKKEKTPGALRSIVCMFEEWVRGNLTIMCDSSLVSPPPKVL